MNDDDIEKVVNNQLKIVNFLEKNKPNEINGDEISRMIIVLATNNCYLGQFVSSLEYALDMSTALRKSIWTDKYSEIRKGIEKVTQRDTEAFADKEVETMVKEEIELKRKLLKVKNLRVDCRELQTALQSRMGQLKSERLDAMLPNIR